MLGATRQVTPGRLVRTVSGNRTFNTVDSASEVSVRDQIRALEKDWMEQACFVPLPGLSPDEEASLGGVASGGRCDILKIPTGCRT